MASVKFYELIFIKSGLVLRSERTLHDLVAWIGKNKCILEKGCYHIGYDGMILCFMFLHQDGRVYFL